MDNSKSNSHVKLNINTLLEIISSVDTQAENVKTLEEIVKNNSLSDFHVKIDESKISLNRVTFDVKDRSEIDFLSEVKLSFVSCNFVGDTSRVIWKFKKNNSLNFKNCKFTDLVFDIEFEHPSCDHAIVFDECIMKNGEVNCYNEIKNNGKTPSAPVIDISNSEIENIYLKGKINSRFYGKNIFGILKSEEYTFDLFYWGGYQKFSTQGDDVFSNRTFFIGLNNNNEIQNDGMQLLNIQKEIAKCNYVILRLEGESSRQDRVLFWFSGLVSHHGTCWITTIAWFFILNLSVMILFGFLTCIPEPRDWNKLVNIYFQLFHPLKTASTIFEVKNNGLASFFDVVHKSFYAILSYELVKTLRRFGRSNATPPRS